MEEDKDDADDETACCAFISWLCNVTESCSVGLNTTRDNFNPRKAANFVINDLNPNDFSAGSPYPSLLICSKLSHIAL